MNNLNEIMKAYFEKEKEVEELLNSKEAKKQVLREDTDEVLNKYVVEKNKLNLRLERLRANKEIEIEQYIRDNFSSQPAFYTGYGATIRKDLERAYEEKEKEIIEEIYKADEKINETRANFNESLAAVDRKSDYKNVYLRELVEQKEIARKNLISYKKELELDLQKEKLNFDRIMLELSVFKYEHNDQNQITNSAAWRELIEKSNESNSRKNELKEILNKLVEYLELTKITDEEKNALMSSLAPHEQMEYDRRNKKAIELSTEEILDEAVDEANEQFDLPSLTEIDAQTQNAILESFNIPEELDEESLSENEFSFDFVEDEPKTNIGIEEIPEDESKTNVEIEETPEDQEEIEISLNSDLYVNPEYTYNGEEISVDDLNNLAGVIYEDIVDMANELKSIKLDKDLSNDRIIHVSEDLNKRDNYQYVGDLEFPTTQTSEEIKLTDGVYFNLKDIKKAIDNYYAKSKKGNKFFVREINQNIVVNKKNLSKLKKAIKKCTTIKLVDQKKITVFDVKRVFGKEAYSDMKTEIGEIQTDLPKGDYVSRDELLYELKNIFNSKDKKIKWLKKLSDKLKRTKKQDSEELIEEYGNLVDITAYDEAEEESKLK